MAVFMGVSKNKTIDKTDIDGPFGSETVPISAHNILHLQYITVLRYGPRAQVCDLEKR